MNVLTHTADFQLPQFPVRRFSVNEYHRMIHAEVLQEDDPVELLNGWIVPKMARNPPHDAVVDITAEELRGLTPAGWRIRVQSAITTATSEPEPDIAVVRGPASLYMSRHPGPADIALLVEAAETSLDRDRKENAPVYAAANIPWYWIVNLADRTVEVYSQPAAVQGVFQFQRVEIKRTGDMVDLWIDNRLVGQIPVDQFFSD
ncbi:MAG: Uma2 family endonuclease [Gemmataceae bacterium]|nr:Uma2 family endonuclease [Gemmataceae bacterium]MCI0742663.1 Uma2 family endonuclease [Gemmataceae bacterium]